jgi:hypothetical protein
MTNSKALPCMIMAIVILLQVEVLSERQVHRVLETPAEKKTQRVAFNTPLEPSWPEVVVEINNATGTFLLREEGRIYPFFGTQASTREEVENNLNWIDRASYFAAEAIHGDEDTSAPIHTRLLRFLVRTFPPTGKHYSRGQTFKATSEALIAFQKTVDKLPMVFLWGFILLNVGYLVLVWIKRIQLILCQVVVTGRQSLDLFQDDDNTLTVTVEHPPVPRWEYQLKPYPYVWKTAEHPGKFEVYTVRTGLLGALLAKTTESKPIVSETSKYEMSVKGSTCMPCAQPPSMAIIHVATPGSVDVSQDGHPYAVFARLALRDKSSTVGITNAHVVQRLGKYCDKGSPYYRQVYLRYKGVDTPINLKELTPLSYSSMSNLDFITFDVPSKIWSVTGIKAAKPAKSVKSRDITKVYTPLPNGKWTCSYGVVSGASSLLRFYHTSTTEYGASASFVYSKTNEVIGLHGERDIIAGKNVATAIDGIFPLVVEKFEYSDQNDDLFNEREPQWASDSRYDEEPLDWDTYRAEEDELEEDDRVQQEYETIVYGKEHHRHMVSNDRVIYTEKELDERFDAQWIDEATQKLFGYNWGEESSWETSSILLKVKPRPITAEIAATQVADQIKEPVVLLETETPEERAPTNPKAEPLEEKSQSVEIPSEASPDFGTGAPTSKTTGIKSLTALPDTNGKSQKSLNTTSSSAPQSAVSPAESGNGKKKRRRKRKKLLKDLTTGTNQSQLLKELLPLLSPKQLEGLLASRPTQPILPKSSQDS